MIRCYHCPCFNKKKDHSKKKDKDHKRNSKWMQQKGPQIAYGKVTVPCHMQ